MNGSLIACDPAAMIALSNFTTFRPVPFLGVTSRWCGSRNFLTPSLQAFAISASPPVNRVTTFSLCVRSLVRSI
jgi:hypothetical protein